MNCLSFEAVFASEEFPEYVGSYNDALLVELDGTTRTVSGSGEIAAPLNFAKDPGGRLLSVKSVFFANVHENNGTQYDGATPALVLRRLLRTVRCPGRRSRDHAIRHPGSLHVARRQRRRRRLVRMPSGRIMGWRSTSRR